MPSLDEFLQLSGARHNHVCPRQVLGVRMGMLAVSLLSLPFQQTNKRLLTIVETDGCFADGVAVTTGCEFGHRTLRLVDYGKVAATFIDTRTGQALRIAPRSTIREAAAPHADTNANRWHSYLEAYQLMSDEDLFVVQSVTPNFSVAKLVSKPKRRITCAHCAEERMNEREVLVDGEVLCRACAGTAYYVTAAPVAEEELSLEVLGYLQTN